MALKDIAAHAAASTVLLLFTLPGSLAPAAVSSARKRVPPAQTRIINSGAAEDKSKEEPSRTGLVKVVLSSSRNDVTRSNAWGLIADITNLSDTPVILYDNEIWLTQQPELARNPPPPHPHPSSLPDSDAHTEDAIHRHTVTLQPGNHYILFWSGKEGGAELPKTTGCRWAICGRTLCELTNELIEFLNFVPGKYTFVVEGRVHPQLKAPSPLSAGSSAPTQTSTGTLHNSALVQTNTVSASYSTFAETLVVQVSISQFAIMICAGIGSLIAFLFVLLSNNDHGKKLRPPDLEALGFDMPWQEKHPGWTSRLRRFAFLLQFLSAFLTGAVVAVILDRLADTSFPIQVSVNDGWGAITIGFLAFFLGDKLLDTLISKLPKSSTNTPPPNHQIPPAEAAQA